MEIGAQRPTSGGPWKLRASLASAITAPFEARRRLEALREVLPSARVADLQAVVTELITRHVRAGGGERIELAIDVAGDGTVHGRVREHGDPQTPIGPPGGIEQDGLGDRIVDALVSRWGVDAPSSAVWFEASGAPGRRFQPPGCGQRASARSTVSPTSRKYSA